MKLTVAQVDELCARSAAGEGVRSVLREFGCDDDETLVWLRDNHHEALKAAKAAQRSGAVPMNEKARAAITAEVDKEAAAVAENEAKERGR